MGTGLCLEKLHLVHFKPQQRLHEARSRIQGGITWQEARLGVGSAETVASFPIQHLHFALHHNEDSSHNALNILSVANFRAHKINVNKNKEQKSSQCLNFQKATHLRYQIMESKLKISSVSDVF